MRFGYDTYDIRLNWKFTIDTFAETYHFTTLRRDTLARTFYGNVQCYNSCRAELGLEPLPPIEG
ncbi:MAG: hypothetical protein JRG94_17345 [Deltaproteobacteria bacterium]|nr:hypothetical protein [Deltaproteobacteria bacterium]MBW2725255.1 hypothetical protein [Deltaproteobacteria bacterium]